jgi:hypothetical protein
MRRVEAIVLLVAEGPPVRARGNLEYMLQADAA